PKMQDTVVAKRGLDVLECDQDQLAVVLVQRQRGRRGRSAETSAYGPGLRVRQIWHGRRARRRPRRGGRLVGGATGLEGLHRGVESHTPARLIAANLSRNPLRPQAAVVLAHRLLA